MTVSVLFVCTANICRSPFMELWARHCLAQAGSDTHVMSAGTRGFHGEPMAAEMQAPLERAGINTPAFRSRRLTQDMVTAADLVLTAERIHRTFVLEDQPRASARVLTLGQAAAAARHVGSGVRGPEALKELARHRSSAASADDVADPYGRGAAAADEAAATITEMLTQVLPVLA